MEQTQESEYDLMSEEAKKEHQDLFFKLHEDIMNRASGGQESSPIDYAMLITVMLSIAFVLIEMPVRSNIKTGEGASITDPDIQAKEIESMVSNAIVLANSILEINGMPVDEADPITRQRLSHLLEINKRIRERIEKAHGALNETGILDNTGQEVTTDRHIIMPENTN